MCVVSTAVGGIPHLLENEVDALLVPPNDSDAMAHAVRRILSEPGLAARLSANARRKAERFDWKRVMPLWSELIAGVIRRGVPA
jgi:glycosyltransferase involved in cell wall biosynthesis